MRLLALVGLFLALASAYAAEGDVSRAVKNENIGTVHLVAPKDWEPIERHHINFGTTFYRLVPPKRTFDFQMLFNDLAHMRMTALTERDLEIYIESNMARAGPRSVEGKPKAVRFGAQKDGVYARLTDKAPNPGEWLYFTQGVRLLGNNVVLFTFYSNDTDGADLGKVLEIVESVRIEK
jgi:hypothetical protein